MKVVVDVIVDRNVVLNNRFDVNVVVGCMNSVGISVVMLSSVLSMVSVWLLCIWLSSFDYSCVDMMVVILSIM